MSNVLKKITTAAKAYRKKHPGASWKSAVKKAGSMYRSGSLKPKRKKAIGKVKTKKRKAAPRKAAKRKTVRRVLVVTNAGTLRKVTRKRRRSVAKKSAPRRRRVGATGKDRFIQTLIIGGLAVGLLVAFTRQRSSTQYVPTGDAYRDSTATRILSIAQAAALSASQIAALIYKLNNSSDAQLQTISDQVESGADISQIA